MSDIPTLVDHLFRRQAGQMVATLTRALGARHLALAEEAVQDALVMALQRWPFRGVPEEPAGWLFQVARNRALDRLRHARVVAEKAPVLERHTARHVPPAAEAALAGELPPLEDDQLGLMFMTCHPVLPEDTRVALTLKIVGGFGVDEIARAFLAQERAVAQRLVRAKRLLRERAVEFGPPADAADLADRLASVLGAIYLMFNEGYAASSGDALLREDIAAEAIRLAALVTRHPPTGVPEAWALLALLLLHAARFPARVGADGTLFLLRDQDRARWDRPLIAEGLRALDRAAGGPRASRYHLEAGVAACHAVAPSWNETDWPEILRFYDALAHLTGSPIVQLNRAIALARVEGPRAGIAAVDGIAGHPALARYHLLPAVLGELWREAGDAARAADLFREALARAGSAPERRFLAARLEGL